MCLPTQAVYEDPEFLENPLLVMSKHPEYKDLYLKDTLFSTSPQVSDNDIGCGLTLTDLTTRWSVFDESTRDASHLMRTNSASEQHPATPLHISV